MSKQPAIRVEALCKAYRIGRAEAKHDTFVSAVGAWLASPWSSFQNVRRLTRFDREDETDMIWALKNVSVVIEPGEVVGVIGRNGAGKSTLLKILARITEPTEGRAWICGRIGSLLEVGTGFHPDLTGRENVYLNGTILGMKKKEIDARFEEIVEFSEVRHAIDTPVKRYSSGMRVRLAFSVAAHLEPEILLVDEVLAVGDAAFQQKCLGKMGNVARHGRTVLFVSHNLGAVTSLCERCLWIDKGTVADDGPVEHVSQRYLQATASQGVGYFSSSHDLAVETVVLKNNHGAATSLFQMDEDLIVEVAFDAKRKLDKPCFWFKVQSSRGPCFTANMQLDGHSPGSVCGQGRIACRFRSIPLLPGSYSILMGIRDRLNDCIMREHDVASFVVEGDLTEHGFYGDVLNPLSRSTPVLVPYEWTLPDGSIKPVCLNWKRDAANAPVRFQTR